MKAKTQSRIARWAAGCGIASFALPWIGLLVVGGIDIHNIYWWRAAAFLALAVTAIWTLERVGKADFRYRWLAWTTGTAYFSTLIALITKFVETPKLILIFGAPEIAGIILCLTGIIHASPLPPPFRRIS